MGRQENVPNCPCCMRSGSGSGSGSGPGSGSGSGSGESDGCVFGYVRDYGGMPVVGQEMIAFDPEAGGGPVAWTGSDGSYWFTTLEYKRYYIYPTTPGPHGNPYDPESYGVEISSPDCIGPLDFQETGGG